MDDIAVVVGKSSFPENQLRREDHLDLAGFIDRPPSVDFFQINTTSNGIMKSAFDI